MQKNDLQYFKIGVFVILSTLCAIVSILFFGAAKYLEPSLYIESYFDESIQGLDVGSPVKYSGITIGHVSKIAMLSSIYTPEEIKNKEMYDRNVYVEMAINPNKVKRFDGRSAENDLESLVGSGLRVRLAAQGFTGTSYLEIAFINGQSATPAITWTPHNLYLPSAPSTYTRFTDAISDILSSLGKVDYNTVFKHMDALAVSSKKALDETNFPALSKKMQTALDNFQETAISFNDMANQLNSAVRETQVKDTFQNLHTISENLKGVTLEAEHTLTQLSSTLQNTNEILTNYRSHIGVILDNTESITENFKIFSETIKESPSQMLWSTTPPALNPNTIQ